MPLPLVPGPLPSYAATDLIPAYTTLIMQQLGDLTDRLAKKPGQPPWRTPGASGSGARNWRPTSMASASTTAPGSIRTYLFCSASWTSRI